MGAVGPAAEAVILALHGFNDYSKGFAAPGKGMARRGFIFYAYDQRGFGRTPERGIWAGETQMIADLRVGARLVKGTHPALPLLPAGREHGRRGHHDRLPRATTRRWWTD